VVCTALACGLAAAEPTQDTAYGTLLRRPFDLAAKRSAETQYYRMETEVVVLGPAGEPQGTDRYKLLLKCVPGSQSGKDADEYTCGRFTMQLGDAAAVEIPALAGWMDGYRDQSDPVFGIDHGRFEGLTDSSGAALPPDKAYAVYNAFVDFHAFCNAFAQPTKAGHGVQDLTQIGQSIVHASAFTEPSTALGSNVREGSVFRNGKVTLMLRGLSLVDDAPCALVGFDSGRSSFTMILEPMPGLKITAVGGSHYLGDIHIDLQSRWVRKVTMTELVVTEVRLPAPQANTHAVVERSLAIASISGEQFAREAGVAP
jgi:hypothetical protein